MKDAILLTCFGLFGVFGAGFLAAMTVFHHFVWGNIVIASGSFLVGTLCLVMGAIRWTVILDEHNGRTGEKG